MATAAVLAGADVYYVSRRRIAPVYLAAAALHAAALRAPQVTRKFRIQHVSALVSLGSRVPDFREGTKKATARAVLPIRK